MDVPAGTDPGWPASRIGLRCGRYWDLEAYAGQFRASEYPSNGVLATKLLAESNPSRHVASVPQFVGELGSLPLIIQRLGRNILRNAAGANVNYHFGIKPLIGDLFKFLQFSDHAQKRAKELTAFYESGIRRKLILFRGSTTSEEREVVADGGSFLMLAKERWIHTVTARGFVRWKPTGTPPMTDDAIRKQAWQAVSGLNKESALMTAWELIPWSWLADWMGNVGTYLQATNNFIPALPYDIQIMREELTEYKITMDRVNWYGKYCSDGVIRCESKSRERATPTLEAQLPYLSGRQLSILGSLAILRLISPGGRLR